MILKYGEYLMELTPGCTNAPLVVVSVSVMFLLVEIVRHVMPLLLP